MTVSLFVLCLPSFPDKNADITSNVLTLCLTGVFPMLVDWDLVALDWQGEERVGWNLFRSSR